MKINCKICKRQFNIFSSYFKRVVCCSKKCSYKRKSNISKGKNHWNWKGGEFIEKDGYIVILKPKHPFCNSCGYIKKHRIIMEKYLGRYLKPEEVVHHINKIRTDNRIKNLKLFKSKSEHIKFHKPIGTPFFNNS